jgi:hypothetical protein
MSAISRREKNHTMKTLRMLRRLAAAAALAAAAVLPARGSGLRTTFGEVRVRHLKIGQTYSLLQVLNLPLRIVNTGAERAEVRIETVAATADLVQGYESAPDWLRVPQSTFTIAPNREIAADLIVTIPNDQKLLGRRFQADIWSHTTNISALMVGLQSRLLIEVDSTPPTEEELKKKFVNEALSNLDFTISPVDSEISDVPLGRAVDLRKERKLAIKVVNPNDAPLTFRVRSIPQWESALPIPDGYEAAVNPQWLTPERELLKVDGNSIAQIGLRLNIDDAPALRGRHFLFLVSFEVLEQKISSRVYYRLLVNTEKAKPAPAPAAK